MSTAALPLLEVHRKGLDLLVRELGPSDAMRFINQFTNGYGDYTKERGELYKDLTVEQIAEMIKRRRNEGTPTAPSVIQS